MKKQLLLLSMILFSSNTFTGIIPENSSAIAKHLAKGLAWSFGGYTIISSSASMHFMKTILKLQEKIRNEGSVTFNSPEEFMKIVQEKNQKNRSFLQTLLPFVLTIPAGYCFVQMWNNYTSMVNVIKN